MEDHNSNYDYNDNDDYGRQRDNKSMKGLKIMIIILAVILGGLSVMYFLQVRNMREDFAVEKELLTDRLTELLGDYDNLLVENDTISRNLETEKFRTDSLLQRLQSERNLSYAKIRDYENQIGYMRTVMEGYIHQIDSLDRINHRLAGDNVSLRTNLAQTQRRADMAEEKASEQDIQLRRGAVVRAREIALIPLNRNDNVVSRARQAAYMRVDLVLVGNELARPGERNVYARIIGPDGYVITESSGSVFDFEGDKITYSAVRHDVDYQNGDTPVSIYYNGGGITAGNYAVSIYMDGHMIGSTEIILK